MAPVQKERNIKEDLLNTAGKLFAQNGLEGTSVRDIIRQAGATLSAVNYYFESKENLFLETIRFVLTEKIRMEDIFGEFQVKKTSSPQELSNKIYSLIEKLTWAFIDPKQPTWYGNFLARAMLEAKPESVEVFLEMGYKSIKQFEANLRELMPHLEEMTEELFTTNLFGQIHFYTLAKDLILRSKTMDNYTTAFIRKVIRDISRNLILPLGLPEPEME
ncbi:DUF1956 domain-containing protein [bacterium]|nr:DUF1956 domain-containing protein [bacterium]